ncbi:MAG: sodium/proline symporter [Natronomonas sp.]|uniref:sodium:solute symporter family transporter n=1 Tax=Natronomonas sp. TaxID=2184060 RepID=UPI002870ABC4|nr:sodium/proline symporter [Natronomonas sp.]MDR9431666.1 sodium/proline symporter [Natronomonas sp.]
MTLPLQAPVEADEPAIIAILVVYLIGVTAVGIWASRETDSTEDFLVTGKRFGIWAIAFAAFASIMSGFGFIGGPGLFYNGGYGFLWIAIVAPLAFPVSWYVLGKKMRLLSEVRDVLTIPDAAYARYESDAVRLLVALSVLLGVISYLGVQFLAIAFILQSVFGVSQVVALLIGLAVIGIYTVGGGMIAGIFTDLIQGAIMVVGSVVVFIIATRELGGFTQMSQDIALAEPTFAGAFGATPVFLGLTWYFLFIVGNSGQPHMAHKLYMIRDTKLLKWGAPIAGLSYFAASLMMLGLGIGMRALVETGQFEALANPDQAAPVFLVEFTPVVIAGIVLAAAVGAVMSTSDAFINIGAANLARDIPESLGYEYDSDAAELRAHRIATAFIIVASVLLVYYVEILVGLLGVVGWGLFAAALVPLLGVGLNWKGATTEGALAAAVVALVGNLGLATAVQFYGFGLSTGANIQALTLIAATVVLIVVSLLTDSNAREGIADDIRSVIEA